MTGDLTTTGIWQRIDSTVYFLHERLGNHGRTITCNKVMFAVMFDSESAVPKSERERLLNEIVAKLNAQGSQ